VECQVTEFVGDSESLPVAGHGHVVGDADDRHGVGPHRHAEVAAELGLEGQDDTTEALGSSDGVTNDSVGFDLGRQSRLLSDFLDDLLVIEVAVDGRQPVGEEAEAQQSDLLRSCGARGNPAVGLLLAGVRVRPQPGARCGYQAHLRLEVEPGVPEGAGDLGHLVVSGAEPACLDLRDDRCAVPGPLA
jgi:hypothetical protein